MHNKGKTRNTKAKQDKKAYQKVQRLKFRVAATQHNTLLMKVCPPAEGSIKCQVLRVAATQHNTLLMKGCPFAEGSIKCQVLRVHDAPLAL
jgi:hypothetical protein